MKWHGQTYAYEVGGIMREIGVTEGLGDVFIVAWRSDSGGAHRVKSPALEPCSDVRALQQIFDRWAELKGLVRWGEPAGTVGGENAQRSTLNVQRSSEEVETSEVVHGLASAATVGVEPGEVTAQYRRALAGCLEMVRFGAMMLEVVTDLHRSCTRATTGAITGREPGLKGWLAEHCPDVNYHTAMRFMHLAVGVRNACRVPEGTPLRLALPGPGGEIDGPVEWSRGTPGRTVSAERLQALRRQVWELVDGKSARQLQFQFMADPVAKGGARPGAGRPERPDDAVIHAGAAWAGVGKKIDAAMNWKFARYLPKAIAEEALETTTFLADALKARLEELKNR
jgi:hypothetical protein